MVGLYWMAGIGIVLFLMLMIGLLVTRRKEKRLREAIRRVQSLHQVR